MSERPSGERRAVRPARSDDARLRVLFLSWKDLAHPEAGGSEIFVDRVIRGLRARGHEAALLCGGPIDARPYLVVRSGSRYDQYLRAPFVARRLGAWDVLVELVNGFPYMAPLWWRGPRICFFHHVHADQWFRHFPRGVADFGWFVEGTLLPRVYRSTVFGALSASTAGALVELGVPRHQIHVVGVGLDDVVDPPTAVESAVPTYVAVGRLVPNKGLDRVLDAWACVEPHIGGRLVVIGDGPDRERIEQRRVPGVELRGWVDDTEKRRLLAEAHLLVHGAHREGWGMVITEAAAVGTPALAFDADGVRDAIVDGATGLIAHDHAEMVRHWLGLAHDGRLRRAMGEAAQRRAATFTWDRSVDQLLAATDRALAVRGWA